MTRLKHLLIGRNPRRTAVRALVLAAVSYVVFGHVVRPVRVQGISMAPTLSDGSLHAINLVAYRRSAPQRGDLVAVAMPGGNAYYLKRVLALPGETVAFEQGRLLIDDRPMDEPYLTVTGAWTMPALRVPADHYFIAGDNRSTLFEGHTLGVVARDRISGRLWL